MTELASDPVELVDQASTLAARPLLALASSTPPPVELEGFAHVSEREPGPWICCAPCSGAMVGHWSAGAAASLAIAHAIREAIPKPHEGGVKPSELRAGVLRELGLTLAVVTTTREAIDARLRAGWALVVPLWYGQLTTHLRRWSPTFTGGHSAALAGVSSSGLWGWWDPLAPAGWRGEYVDPDVVIRAAWDGVAGAPRAVARRTDAMLRFGVERWRVPAGTPFYEAPGGASAGRYSRDTDVTAVGVPLDNSADHVNWGWRAVLASTQAVDGVSALKLVYLQRSTMTSIAIPDPTWPARATALLLDPRPAPPAPGEPDPDALAAARLEGRRIEWARWHGELGIPPEPTSPDQ